MKFNDFILSVIRKNAWSLFAVGVLFSAGSTSMLYAINIINSAVRESRTDIAPEIAKIGGLVLLNYVVLVSALNMISKMSMRFVTDLRADLLARVAGLPLDYVESAGKNKIYPILTEDVFVVARGVQAGSVAFLYTIMCVFCFLYILYLSPVMFLVVASLLCIVLIYQKINVNLAMRHVRESRRHMDKLYGGLHGFVEGFHDLALKEEKRRYHLSGEIGFHSNALGVSNYQAELFFNRNDVLGSSAVLLAILSVLCLFHLFGSKLGLELKVLAEFCFVVFFMSSFVTSIVDSVPFVSRGFVSLKRIAKYLDSFYDLAGYEKSGENNPSAVLGYDSEEHNSWAAIDYVNFEFYRAKESAHLGPLSFKVMRGEVVFITGGNGAGKTTLLKCLSLLYGDKGGEIYRDGNIVDRNDYRHIKNLFGGVFQNSYLFKYVLRKDGTFPCDEEVNTLLRKFKLDGLTEIKGGEYSNVDLSYGQRKRLILISEILSDKDILLFDEVAADQDVEFKEYFYRECIPYLRGVGKTLIVVTHDQDYLDCADRVFSLEYGTLAERKYPAVGASSLHFSRANE